MKSLITFVIVITVLSSPLRAQNPTARLSDRRNVITTAVPFLTINTNAQSRAMGEVGVVASDLYTQNGLQQNPAMLCRETKVLGIQTLDYIPWLRQLVPDVKLFSTGAHLSFNKNSAIGLYAKYFSLGSIQFTDDFGNPVGSGNPYEYSIEGKFAHRLSEDLSLGIGIKYIHSSLVNGFKDINGIQFHPAKAIAGDLGLDYRKKLLDNGSNTIKWNFGLAILNVGNKITYSDASQKDFLPQSVKLGNMLTFKKQFPDKSSLAFDLSYQIDKLLVPTPPIFAKDANGLPLLDANGNQVIEKGRDPNVNPIQGMLQSFYDAPGGSREEFHELLHQFGGEIRYCTLENRFLFASRGGYFLEHETKGGRKYITLGAGLGIMGFRLDLAYLIPMSQRHPLQNTVAISFGMRFNLEGKRLFRFV